MVGTQQEYTNIPQQNFERTTHHNSMISVPLLIPRVYKDATVHKFCTYLRIFLSILPCSLQVPSLNPSLYLLGRRMVGEVNIL